MSVSTRTSATRRGSPAEGRPGQPADHRGHRRAPRARRPWPHRPAERLAPADQPGRGPRGVADRQQHRHRVAAEAPVTEHAVEHRGPPDHDDLADLRHAAGGDGHLAGAGGDRLRDRRRLRADPGHHRGAQPVRRERRGPDHAGAAHAAAVRAYPGVHRLVRDRRDAEDHADRARRCYPALPQHVRRHPRRRRQARRTGPGPGAAPGAR